MRDQVAHDAAVAASTARFMPEQSELLDALRAIGKRDDLASQLSSNLEDLRHNARCLASAMANGMDASEYIEALRRIGAGDLK